MQIMDQNLIRASQEAGFCSRIRYNALPYNLTLLSTGFIQIWLVGRGVAGRGGGWAGRRQQWPSCCALCFIEHVSRRIAQEHGCGAAGVRCQLCAGPPITPGQSAPHPAGCPLVPQLLAPFGLWNTNYWFGLFPYFFMAVLMLGCDEVASQLEDPFSLLPVDDILFVATRDVKK